MIRNSKFINNYFCKSGGHWIPKENAKIINSTVFCPECKKKLRTKPQKCRNKIKVVQEPII